MPRSRRVDYEGARHHVLNRGAARGTVFRDDEDRAAFLEILEQAVERHGIRVHAWALMGNHYHLLVTSVRANLSEAMRDVGARYTQHHNRRHGRDGAVLRGRFLNRLVGNDIRYWMHLLYYVDANPVDAGVVARPEASRWTSYRAYMGLDPAPAWLETTELLRLHKGRSGYAAYWVEQSSGAGGVPDNWDPDGLWRTGPTEAVPNAEVWGPATIGSRWGGEALREVAAITGVPENDLLAPRRGPSGNRPRWVAIWWLVTNGIKAREIARDLGVSPPAVSRMITRLEAERAAGGDVQRWVEALLASRQ